MAVPVLFYLSERKKHAGETRRSTVKTVINAVDMSPQSAIAMQIGDSIARRIGAESKVLYAMDVEAPPYFTSSQVPEIEAEEQFGIDEAMNELKVFIADNLEPGNAAVPVIVEENPIAAIENEAEKADTVLITLGTHGRSGWDKLRFGSVAESVLRDFDGPVLTVNPKVTKASDIRTILCTVDPSTDPENALRYAAELANQFNANLKVLRIVDRQNVGAKGFDAIAGSLTAGVLAGVTFDEVVRHGDLCEQVTAVMSENEIDLIVVGVEHGLFTDESLGESTAEILRESTCPVITVPS